MKTKKLVLGTANLGSRYGIANSMPFELETSKKIFSYALNHGINTLDTAPDYGIAESLIGEAKSIDASIKVISKIPIQNKYNLESVMKSIDSTLINIKSQSIYGILFHDPDVYNHKEIRSISRAILASGKVERIGFSSYSERELIRAKAEFAEWTLFQLPENILDQRHYHSSDLMELQSTGNEIYVRSIFLQGLLTMQLPSLGGRFSEYKKTISQIQSIGKELKVSAVDLCLSYGESIPWSAGTIIAAASIKQLDEILNYKSVTYEYSILETLSTELLDPRRWFKQ